MKIYAANKEKSDFDIIQEFCGKEYWIAVRLAGRSSRISWIRIIEYNTYEIVTTAENTTVINFNKLEESNLAGFVNYYSLEEQMNESYSCYLEDISIIRPLNILTTDEIIEVYNAEMNGD